MSQQTRPGATSPIASLGEAQHAIANLERIMDSLTQEVNALVQKQQAKLKKSQAEAAAKQAELDRVEQEKKNGSVPIAALAYSAMFYPDTDPRGLFERFSASLDQWEPSK